MPKYLTFKMLIIRHRCGHNVSISIPMVRFLKLISFNIRFDISSDGVHQWKFRLPILSRYIEDDLPHILSTQEGREPQLRELQSELKSLTMVESHREWLPDRMYPCIFYHHKKLELEESGDIWLSETPHIPGSSSFDSNFPRLCVWALFTLKSSNKKVFLVNTHLDHVHEHTRLNQIKVLIEEIKKEYRDDYLLFINGDFNEAPSGNVRSEINRSLPFLTDYWQDLRYDEESTFHKFKGVHPIENGGARIDWIMSDKRAKGQSIQIDKISQNGIYPSDHFPIKSVYSL